MPFLSCIITCIIFSIIFRTTQELFHVWNIFIIHFLTFLKNKITLNSNRKMWTSTVCPSVRPSVRMSVCNCPVIDSSSLFSLAFLSHHCMQFRQTTCFWLWSLHTGTLHFPHLLFTLRSLLLGQIWHLFLFGWPCLLLSCGWVVAFVTPHLSIASIIGVCSWGHPSSRLLMCGVTSSFDSSLRKSRRALVMPLLNSGCWAEKKV